MRRERVPQRMWVPRPKISASPLLLFKSATGLPPMLPPSPFHEDHPPPGEVCQMCHTALSVPMAKASTVPLVLVRAAGLLRIVPPSEVQPDQVPPGAVSAIVHKA